MDESLRTTAARIRLVVLDVDGVLTDGSIWTGPAGEAIKHFYTRDGLGIRMLQWAGIPVALLTGRISEQTAKRASELGIRTVKQGKTFKGRAFDELVKELGVPLPQVAYMGDDVPDIPPLKAAGLPACPADASKEVLELAKFVCPHKGGYGAVRDLAEFILRSQDKWDRLVDEHYVYAEEPDEAMA